MLQIASDTDAKPAAAAFGYLVDNVGLGQPYEQFHPRDFPNFKFVLAVKPDGTKSMESPHSVYTNANSAIMGFAVLDASLKSKAKKLHIEEYPRAAALINVLSSKPSKDPSTAQRWFEFLATRSGGESSAPLQLVQV